MSEATGGPLELGPFAGRWVGTITWSNDPGYRSAVQISIPAVCGVGEACGTFEPSSAEAAAVGCILEVRLLGLEGNSLRYDFARLLRGDACHAEGIGTLTLQEDGRLLRDHRLGSTTVSGPMRRVPGQ
jgi:hypothetical protein